LRLLKQQTDQLVSTSTGKHCLLGTVYSKCSFISSSAHCINIILNILLNIIMLIVCKAESSGSVSSVISTEPGLVPSTKSSAPKPAQSTESSASLSAQSTESPPPVAAQSTESSPSVPAPSTESSAPEPAQSTKSSVPVSSVVSPAQLSQTPKKGLKRKVSLTNISPLPVRPHSTTKKRFSTQATVLTSSPYKQSLRERESLRGRKKESTKKALDDKSSRKRKKPPTSDHFEEIIFNQESKEQKEQQ